MLRLLFTTTIILMFFLSSALAAPTPVRKVEPFNVYLILKTVDGRFLESVGYNVQVYTPRRVPLSYTKVVCCPGCGGADWSKR